MKPVQQQQKKIIRYSLLLITIGVLLTITVLLYRAVPIITGYCAKSMCSEVFLARRDPLAVSREDLGFFPISLGKCNINRQDSSVTASLWGCWQQTALFRRGLGSTLLHGTSKDSLRKQGAGFYHWLLPEADTAEWLRDDHAANTSPVNLHREQINMALNDFFMENDSAARKNTRAVLVLYDGHIIAERYAPGFNQQSMFLGWSMGKSIGGALVGILQKQGRLKINDAMALRNWTTGTGDKRLLVTVKDVLQQASGLDFEEDYAKRSDVTRMLYLEPDMGNFTAAHPLLHAPGSFFYYSSGNANLLSLKLRELLGGPAYHVFPYEGLFNRIGMRHTLFELDAAGSFIFSSYVYASARDWARFGLLYLNKGRCNGVQLLDSNWVKDSFQPAATDNFNHYGYQFWLNRGNDTAAAYRAFPHAPADMVYAGGFQGQNLFIIPSKKMLVVRLGMSAKPDYHADHSLGLLMEAVD